MGTNWDRPTNEDGMFIGPGGRSSFEQSAYERKSEIRYTDSMISHLEATGMKSFCCGKPLERLVLINGMSWLTCTGCKQARAGE